MSGRSAHVRKKITEPKTGDGRNRSSHSVGGVSSHDELPTVPFGPSRPDVMALPTANPRMLRSAPEQTRDGDSSSLQGSLSSDSIDGRRGSQSHHNRPLDDFAYARARKPTIKSEDMSGITKSGVRSAMDNKSEQVRKGIAKAFAFGSKKGKRGETERAFEIRPESAATMRPGPPPHTVSYSSEPQMPPLDEHNQPQYPLPHSPYEQQWGQAIGPASPPPLAKLPPLPPLAAAPQIKRWIGTGRPVQRWNKLRKDPELWDPNGDVLIYLGHRGQEPRPHPSFRLSSHLIESTESRILVTMLREGSTEDDAGLPPSPLGAPLIMLPRPNSLSAVGRAPAAGHHFQAGALGSEQPTPPLSEDTNLADADGQISYEMFFPPPSNATKTDQLRHNITTRNVFALLCHASLVGLSLHQALTDLHARMEQYMTQADTDNLFTIISYLSARGIDDVRDDPETAISLLAWSEDPRVRWEEGWRECFYHAAGMYGSVKQRSLMESSPGFKKISPISRALLDRASLEMHLRVQSAEERLAAFSFEDMWPASFSMMSPISGGPSRPSPAKESADRLQRFFVEHYRAVYGGRWPPPPPGRATSTVDGEESLWLTRTVAQTLQKGFGALYEYLVNRDIVWDGSETRSSRKWLMVSESGNKGFDADTVDLPMTDLLIEFDNKQRYPHIPHPYPLVPESIQPSGAASTGANTNGDSAKSILKRGKTMIEGVTTSQRSGPTERRVQLAYTESSNIYTLGSDFTQSDLIDAYVKFEKNDHIGEVDPSLARRGRWILIYGILQTLASISVDAPNVRYSEGVSYHLDPRLKGARIPPWTKNSKHATHAGPDEARHELSYCWMAPQFWRSSDTSASSDAGTDRDSQVFSDVNNQVSPPTDLRRGFGFPRPPPPVSFRGSLMSHHMSANRSLYSSGSRMSGNSFAPTFGYPASVMSYDAQSDTGTTASSWKYSSNSPTTTAAPGFPRRRRSTKNGGYPANPRLSTATSGSGSRRGAATSSLASSRVDEDNEEWAIRAAYERAMMHGAVAAAAAPGGGGPDNGRETTAGGDKSGARDYLYPDDSTSRPTSRPGSFGVEEDEEEEEEEAGSGSGSSGDQDRHGRPLLSLSPSETDSVAPAFRDFDELDVDDIMP
ncbi:hypothetical protein VSDG_03092 [Cytospora chrysosperma]|uniref:DUF8004 domain-containing protein n=1 Tax=Cytospora chrysosperma TaxID=252740 RepID=A0A423W8T3_CYTCH|nr:hypothetical protein VSDG_03092 [Valsa sordida]